MFEGQAKLTYYSDYAVAYIDKGIYDFYRWLIPKARKPQPQKYPPHITVVRRSIEKPTVQDNWRKYEGQSVLFRYDGLIHTNGIYYWLDAWSDEIGRIREELGLGFYRPPFDRYHISLGNEKQNS